MTHQYTHKSIAPQTVLTRPLISRGRPAQVYKRSYTAIHKGIFKSHSEGASLADSTSGVQATKGTQSAARSARAEAAAENDIGKVLYTGQGLAIIDGLNNDAPVGTKLTFVSGGTGVLIWRRDDNLCYVLLLGGQPVKGEGVMCKARGLIQVIDEEAGPTMKTEYEITTVPVGEELTGTTTDFLGRQAEGQQLGISDELPLFNEQAPMDDREQIQEPLFTGLKAVDVLTPIGRGQALLVIGAPGSGKTSLVLDAIFGQKQQGVHCIYASVGQSADEGQRQVELLQQQGAMSYTSVLCASSEQNLGERYAALCSACSRGEQIRDSGGHALVVLDDIRCLVEMWEHISEALVEIGLSVVPSSSKNGSESDLGKEIQQEKKDDTAVDEEELVSYEGMLVSAAAAQRRHAKLHERKGGGSLTLLLVLPGSPATGRMKKKPNLSKYQHLSPELKAKLEAALSGSQTESGTEALETARTEVIEEFMSLADGQAVTIRSAFGAETEASFGQSSDVDEQAEVFGGFGPASEAISLPSGESAKAVRVNAAASISRIGGRALHPALKDLALSARLDLVQALDANEFSANRSDPKTKSALNRAGQLNAALLQLPGSFVPLEEQVAVVFATQSGLLKAVSLQELPGLLIGFVKKMKTQYASLMEGIANTKELPDGAEDLMTKALREHLSELHL